MKRTPKRYISNEPVNNGQYILLIIAILLSLCIAGYLVPYGAVHVFTGWPGVPILKPK